MLYNLLILVVFPSEPNEQWDYTNKTVKGQGQHVRMKHRVSQVGGNIDMDEESIEETSPVAIIGVQFPCPLCKEGGQFCTGTCIGKCEGCDQVRTQTEYAYILLIMNQHKSKEVPKYSGRDYVIKHQHTISRNMDIFQDVMHSSKWDNIYKLPCNFMVQGAQSLGGNPWLCHWGVCSS